MEACATGKTLKKEHSRFRLFRRNSTKTFTEQVPAKNPIYDAHFSKQASSQRELLDYITEKLIEPAPCNTRLSPTDTESPLEKDNLLKPESQIDRLSSRLSLSRKSSQCSCSSKSLRNSRRPSTSSRRLSIYFLPPESVDLEDLTNNYDDDMPRYISRSPVSDSEMEYFSFPPSSRSHDQHRTSPANPQDVQQNTASCSTAVYQDGSPLVTGIHKASPEIKSCQETASMNSSSRQCAHDYLQLGIKAHEEDDLKLSATLFRRSATEAGGCGLGMLMWALSLRHGWGCKVDTEKAYWWLQLSAETLVQDLENLKSEMTKTDLLLAGDQSADIESHSGHEESVDNLMKECKAITSELLLASYELGQCLMRGWGCQRDKILVSILNNKSG